MKIKRNNIKNFSMIIFLKSFSGRLVGYTDATIAVLSEEIKNEKYTIVYTKLIGTSEKTRG